MIAGVALLVCLLALAWLFLAQRRRHRERRADIERQLASSRSWYESANALSRDEAANGAEQAEPRDPRRPR
jgi:hypothetical protein